MRFFSEFRQRRLFQIVASYLAAGWIALEVLDQLTQHEVLPELAYELGLLWYLAGIPAAVLVGWHHGEKGRQKAPVSELLILTVVGLSVLGFSGFRVADHVTREAALAAARESALALDRIAVLYFEDLSADQQLQHVADGLTESLIEEFARVRNFEVVSRNGVARFRGEDIPPESIAAELRAGTLVQGDIRRSGDNVRVSVRLLEGETGAAFGRRVSFERPADDFFAIQDELAREVSRMLREWLGDEVDLRRSRRETTSQAAWVLYQRAEKARKDAESALRHHDDHAAHASFARADSILDHVEQLDPQWPAPAVLRGELAYRRARLSHDRHERIAHIDEGLAAADRALALDPIYARAVGLRGILRYYRYIQNVVPEPDRAEALRQAARQDLERAVELDPTQAVVWSALNHLYYSAESAADAVRAGERAYEEDAYLDVADQILWRLYTGHYDLGNFTRARQNCEEGARRFPENDRFATCELELLHTAAFPPDADRAWQLAARIDSLAQPHRREFARVQSEIFVAGALHRAGLADSARAVLRRAHDRVNPELDPRRELLTFEAAMWSMLGDDDQAIDLLKRHKAANPDASFDHHWWWRTVRSHPRYPEIASSHH